MNQSLAEIVKANAQSNKQKFKKSWTHDKYKEPEDDNPAEKYFVKVSNLHWNVTEADLKSLFGGERDVEKVKLKYDVSGRSEGIAEILFKSKAKAQEYQSKFNGETLDGMPLLIEMLRPFRAKKANQPTGSIFDRLGKTIEDRLGKKGGSIEDRLGKKGSIEDRLGSRIQDRLGKRIEDRLGPKTDDKPKKKKNKKKKNAAMDVDSAERTVADYADADIPQGSSL